MVLPTVFSDVAADEGARQPSRQDGAVYPIEATYTNAAVTAENTVVGMIRVRKGMRCLMLNCKLGDNDTASNTSVDVGVVYDDTVQGTDVLDGFQDGLDTHTSAIHAVGHPGATAEAFNNEFVATGNGYISLKILGGATTTAVENKLVGLFKDGEV